MNKFKLYVKEIDAAGNIVGEKPLGDVVNMANLQVSLDPTLTTDEKVNNLSAVLKDLVDVLTNGTTP